jgi:membrane protease YdiL (CAAX protease family)
MSLLGALIVSAVLTFGLTARVAWPRLVVEQFPSRARRLLAYLVLSMTLALTTILPLSHFGQPPPDLSSRLALPELFLGHALLATCLALWWALAGFRPAKQFLHLRFDQPMRQLRVGILAGLGGWAATLLAMTVVGLLAGVGSDAGTGVEGEIPEVMRAIVALPLGVRIALVCSAGIVEELFFRSFLQSRSGLLLSTVLFTASHTSYGLPLMLVGVFVVSVVLGRVFRRRDDVVPCMIAHALFDAIQLFVVLPVVVAAK